MEYLIVLKYTPIVMTNSFLFELIKLLMIATRVAHPIDRAIKIYINGNSH